MKIWMFLFFMACLTFGANAILFFGYMIDLPVWVSYLLGGLWGYIVGKVVAREIKNECR